MKPLVRELGNFVTIDVPFSSGAYLEIQNVFSPYQLQIVLEPQSVANATDTAEVDPDNFPNFALATEQICW